MIDTGFKLTATEMRKLDGFRTSAAYGTYLKSIKASPVYSTIVREYVKNIDIKSDVVRMQSDGHLPDGVSADTLNTLFKQSISRMAINMVADTILMMELETKRLDDVLHDIKTDSDVVYIMGLAEEKYYKEAEKLLEEGKLERNSVAYRGLLNWNKLKEKLPKQKPEEKETLPCLAKPIEPVVSKKKPGKIDYDSLDITM
jgi:hypothetical protein